MLPPFFTSGSHRLPHQVQRTVIVLLYSCTITCAGTRFHLRRSLLANALGAKLQDVFITSFPCASHQPATFCRFPMQLLVLFIAYATIIAISKLFVKPFFRNLFLLKILLLIIGNMFFGHGDFYRHFFAVPKYTNRHLVPFSHL